jgi:hypothetical protein
VYCSERKLCADFSVPTTMTLVSAIFPCWTCRRGALTSGYPKCSPGESPDLCLDRTTTASLMSLPPWRHRFRAIYTGLVVWCLHRSVVCRFVACGGVCEGGWRWSLLHGVLDGSGQRPRMVDVRRRGGLGIHGWHMLHGAEQLLAWLGDCLVLSCVASAARLSARSMLSSRRQFDF